MTGQPRENVAIFNPLVLPLPNWHPDGPDGMVDGFVIPFVFPENSPTGRQPNRGARIRVYPTEHGWRASLMNCQDHAETAEQARAFAAAWIRTAEVLENVAKADELRNVPQRIMLGAEVQDQADEFVRQCCSTPLTGPHSAGCWLEPREDNPIDYTGPAKLIKPNDPIIPRGGGEFA